MKIPSHESVRRFVTSHPWIQEKVNEIARRLLALKEYNKEQAIFVAADIVRNRYKDKLQMLAKTSLLETT